MERIELVQEHLKNIVYSKKISTQSLGIYNHLLGVSWFCSLLALKRRLNPELATISGLLHDIHYLVTGSSVDHAIHGSKLANELLRNLGVLDPEEINLICTAIYHHSDKKGIHGAYDELLKDADVLQHSFYNITLPPYEKDKKRFKQLRKELDLASPKKLHP